MMRKLLGVLAVCAAALIPAAPALAAPRVLSNVSIFNDQLQDPVQYHGLGNLITVGTDASHMYQADCHNVNWVTGGQAPVCEWGNASGLCFGASQGDGLIRAEICTGATTQLWWTAPTGGGAGLYWLLNSHWSGVAGSDVYATPTAAQLGSDIAANVGPGRGDLAIWQIG